MSRSRQLRLLALGGTIACRSTRRGLVPRLRARDLLVTATLPARTRVEPVDFLERTIVYPGDWQALAREIFAARADVDGCVITLGTDSLAFVAAALALMLVDIDMPVVLTGAMVPPGKRGADGQGNLSHALRVAAAGVPGVYVVFSGQVLSAASVTKLSCDSPRAFVPVNVEPLARVTDRRVTWRARPAGATARPRLVVDIDTNVDTAVITPQTDRAALNRSGDGAGLLVLGYGDGNLPAELVPPLRRRARRAVVVLASQCPLGEVSHRYEGGAAAIRSGVLSAGSMSNEMALVRLMWSLGNGRHRAGARRIFAGLAKTADWRRA